MGDGGGEHPRKADGAEARAEKLAFEPLAGALQHPIDDPYAATDLGGQSYG